MKTPPPSESTPLVKPELTEIQVEAITEFDALLHPAALAGFLQTSSRDQWSKIAAYMDALKELLPPKPTLPTA